MKKKSKISFYIGERSMDIFLIKFVDQVKPGGSQLFNANWYEPVTKWSCTLVHVHPDNPDFKVFKIKIPLSHDTIHNLTHDLIGLYFKDLMNELGIKTIGVIKVTITKTKTY